jgi:hypothetical protein
MTQVPLADRRFPETLGFEVGEHRALVARFIREITKHFGPPREIVIRPSRSSIPTSGARDEDQSRPE